MQVKEPFEKKKCWVNKTKHSKKNPPKNKNKHKQPPPPKKNKTKKDRNEEPQTKHKKNKCKYNTCFAILNDSLQSSLLHYITSQKFWLLNATIQQNDFTYSKYLVTLWPWVTVSHTTLYQSVEFNGVCHITSVERDQFTGAQMQVMLKVYFIKSPEQSCFHFSWILIVWKNNKHEHQQRNSHGSIQNFVQISWEICQKMSTKFIALSCTCDLEWRWRSLKIISNCWV